MDRAEDRAEDGAVAEPIRYDVDLRDRRQHLVHVTVHVPADLADGGVLTLSVWTPGSYVVRDYARHVQRVAARDPAGDPVALEPERPNVWRLPTGGGPGGVAVTFELYANDLSVRTNHVDDHHALLVAAATFPVLAGGEDRPHHVRVVGAGTGDHLHGMLPPDGPGLRARDRDHLIDSALEVGDFPLVDREVDGAHHRFVWAGHAGQPDLARVGDDLVALALTARDVFGGTLPATPYTVLALGWDEGGGGLEHRDGAVLQVPVHTFEDDEAYARFQSLLAHEYFHRWNVKRLVPAQLVRPAYDRPTYCESLWVAEGWTAYYDKLLPSRARCWAPRRLLEALQQTRLRVDRSPGTDLQSLRAASREAWVKHYRPDENRPNAITDYYAHGSLVALELDLRLRAREPAGDGLDAVLRSLWDRHAGGQAGYTEDDVLRAVAEVGGDALAELVEHRVAVPGGPELDDVVATVGLRWVEATDPVGPDLGVETRDVDGAVVFASVLRGGPAWTAGLTGGDRLVAVDDRVVTAGRLAPLLRGHDPGHQLDLTVVRGPRLLRVPVVLAEPHPHLRLQPVADPDMDQRRAFEHWSGQPLPDP